MPKKGTKKMSAETKQIPTKNSEELTFHQNTSLVTRNPT